MVTSSNFSWWLLRLISWWSVSFELSRMVDNGQWWFGWSYLIWWFIVDDGFGEYVGPPYLKHRAFHFTSTFSNGARGPIHEARRWMMGPVVHPQVVDKRCTVQGERRHGTAVKPETLQRRAEGARAVRDTCGSPRRFLLMGWVNHG